MKTQSIMIDGQPVSYLEGGNTSAAPIVLLHGSVGDASFHWSYVMPELAQMYRLIAPDLPGFGQTPPLPDMTYIALLDWIKQVYDALELEQAVLVGTSFGGLLARFFASAYPQEVPALILINGGVLPGKASGVMRQVAGLPWVGDLLFSFLSRQGVSSREALDWVVNHPANTEVLTEPMVQTARDNAHGLGQVMKMQTLDSIPENRVPMVPTLLLWGSEDTISPVTAGERVHKAIPGSEFRPVGETKHAPHIDEPEVIAFQIEVFLENLGRPQSPNLPGAGKLG